MNITINGSKFATNTTSLKDLIEETDQVESNSSGIAIAVNDTVIHKKDWETYELKDGDSVEVIQAVQGG